MNWSRIRIVNRLVLTKRDFQRLLTDVDTRTRDLQPLQTDSARRLGVLTDDSASLLEAADALVATLADAVDRLAGLEGSVASLEARSETALGRVERELESLREHVDRRSEALEAGVAAVRDEVELTGAERLLQGLARRGWRPRCIYDVGASDGRWARMAVRVFPDAVLHLFEPLADSHYAEGLQPLAEGPCALGERWSSTIARDLALDVGLDGVHGLIRDGLDRLLLPGGRTASEQAREGLQAVVDRGGDHLLGDRPLEDPDQPADAAVDLPRHRPASIIACLTAFIASGPKSRAGAVP